MQYGSDGIKIRREAETMYQKLMTCLESVREKTDFKPEIALVLGSGLGDFAERIQIEQIIKYTDIEGFPVSTVKGHKGRFVFGYVEKTPVVIMQGRVHYYEGYTSVEIAGILKKPQSTIRNYLHEARAILKERLGDDFDEEQ